MKANKRILATLSMGTLMALALASCCGGQKKSRCCDCGTTNNYYGPKIDVNGNDNVVNYEDVDISNSGSGNINYDNRTNINNGSGNQNVNSHRPAPVKPKPQSKPKEPQPKPEEPKLEPKPEPVVVSDTTRIIVNVTGWVRVNHR